jgi:hypothetical protein
MDENLDSIPTWKKKIKSALIFLIMDVLLSENRFEGRK